jgi:hypothetical protein
MYYQRRRRRKNSCGLAVPANLAAAMRSILPVIDVNFITVDVCRQLQPLWYQCTISYENIIIPSGYAVAQLVEALRYKRKGHGFDSRWSHWNFSVTLSIRSHFGPGVDSASNRNEYQESFLGVKTAGA